MLNLRKTLSLLCVFFVIRSFGQNKQVLYNFAELPQTLILNPGAETNFNYHFGVPLLSGISSEIGITGFAVSDLFSVDNRTINEKVSKVINNLSPNDHVKFNFQVEVLNAGFRLNDNKYFSFGFYEEFDGIIYIPKDLITFATEGNSGYLNKSFELLSQTVFKIDALGVLHFGLTNKVNENLTLGARFKIYSSALNIESFKNTGTLTTVNGFNNLYTHYIDNVYLDVRSSGLVKDDEFIEIPNKYFFNTFFGDTNLGIGFDFGFTFHLSDQMEVTGSLLDVGFVEHSKNIQNAVIEGGYISEGITYENYSTNTSAFDLLSEPILEEDIALVQNEESYISWRPPKLNASFTYSFGMKRSKYCYDNTHKEFYGNALGVQLYSVYRPLGPQLAFTGFYQKLLSQKFAAKVTYTIDNYSLNNIGVGLSTQLGKLNVYGMIDHILEFSNIAAANHISAQLGFNILF